MSKWAILASGILVVGVSGAAEPVGSLGDRLSARDPGGLAAEAREKGDPARGALLFHQAQLGCSGCHRVATAGVSIGPDLARGTKERTPAELIESILDPSKVIREGYETVRVARKDGTTLTGILAEERPEALLIRDPARQGEIVVLPGVEVEDRKVGGLSVMPAGLVNLLDSREEFLDLAAYVLAIAAEGPRRALELRPSQTDLLPPPLPAYESDLDHAGLIAGLDDEAFRRGGEIYGMICANCHGTVERPGSLPNALRFASGAFKNGGDPFAMYRTITKGYGQMPPQATLVPREKYDVIHYIREAFVRQGAPDRYANASPDYLAGLPKGSLKGPRPMESQPWAVADYGRSLSLSVEVKGPGSPIAYKGVAIRLDPGQGGVVAGRRWLVYDHDTMSVVGAWSGQGFIDWNSILFNGKHAIHPRTIGKSWLVNPVGPGWADPASGRFEDPRLRGRDGLPYGPLPRAWLAFQGQYNHGERVVLSYRVGGVEVLESPGSAGDRDALIRTIQVGKSSADLALRVAPAETPVKMLGGRGASTSVEQGYQVVRIPAASTPTALNIVIGEIDPESLGRVTLPGPLEPFTKGGPTRWARELSTRIEVGENTGPFASDVLTIPSANPWRVQVRLSGLDFLEGGRAAAVCTWDGDVWFVSGLGENGAELTWRRIASGLFQPLGLKVVDGLIYVACRDQIVILRDLNGDGETDFYECFNSDHQVTEHFHEFAMDLQTDAEGNFYYTKAARHALTPLVPHHGTLLKVLRDGSATEILATGFRAPNGVCLNPDGSFFVTDQEGHWTPKNRVNRVVPGGFYGNMWGYHGVTDASDDAMRQPVCWITNAFDRSPAQMHWVRDPRWGPLNGSLISMSYGYGKLFVVPHERVGGQDQGGMVEFPIPRFPTGLIRGRFHPESGDLYLCGLYSWAGSQTSPGGLYRLRPTGKPMGLVVGLKAREGNLSMTFTEPLEASLIGDLDRYAVTAWDLTRSANYGSRHINERSWSVTGASLSEDGKTVTLTIPDLRPTRGMQVAYSLRSAKGDPVEGRVHETIHALAGD